MRASELPSRSWKARLVAGAFALVASLSTLAAVLAVFASSSGELAPVLAKLKPAPIASSAVAREARKPGRG